MSKINSLARDTAIILAASVLMALSYNAFSPKPLPLIRTETSVVAPDSLITALASTQQTQEAAENAAGAVNTQNSGAATTKSAAAPGSVSQSENIKEKAKENGLQARIAAGAEAPSNPTKSERKTAQESVNQIKSNTAEARYEEKSGLKNAGKSDTKLEAKTEMKTEVKAEVKVLEIRTDQVEKLLQNPDVLFIDARPAREFEAGKIGNAINIYTPEFESNIHRVIGLPREKPIVAYCGGGACELSHELADNLRRMGFQRVFVYVGGWNEWKQRK